jgi:hypothetical protein
MGWLQALVNRGSNEKVGEWMEFEAMQILTWASK